MRSEVHASAGLTNSTGIGADLRGGRGRESERTGHKESAAHAHPSMHEFVCEQNICRFADQFQIAHDPHTRKSLQKLLLAEVNKFNFNSKHLERIQQRIRECQGRIGKHEILIQKARANGRDTATAERVLNNLIELEEIFWNSHQVVLQALNRGEF